MFESTAPDTVRISQMAQSHLERKKNSHQQFDSEPLYPRNPASPQLTIQNEVKHYTNGRLSQLTSAVVSTRVSERRPQTSQNTFFKPGARLNQKNRYLQAQQNFLLDLNQKLKTKDRLSMPPTALQRKLPDASEIYFNSEKVAGAVTGTVTTLPSYRMTTKMSTNESVPELKPKSNMSAPNARAQYYCMAKSTKRNIKRKIVGGGFQLKQKGFLQVHKSTAKSTSQLAPSKTYGQPFKKDPPPVPQNDQFMLNVVLDKRTLLTDNEFENAKNSDTTAFRQTEPSAFSPSKSPLKSIGEKGFQTGERILKLAVNEIRVKKPQKSKRNNSSQYVMTQSNEDRRDITFEGVTQYCLSGMKNEASKPSLALESSPITMRSRTNHENALSSRVDSHFKIEENSASASPGENMKAGQTIVKPVNEFRGLAQRQNTQEKPTLIFLHDQVVSALPDFQTQQPSIQNGYIDEGSIQRKASKNSIKNEKPLFLHKQFFQSVNPTQISIMKKKSKPKKQPYTTAGTEVHTGHNTSSNADLVYNEQSRNDSVPTYSCQIGLGIQKMSPCSRQKKSQKNFGQQLTKVSETSNTTPLDPTETVKQDHSDAKTMTTSRGPKTLYSDLSTQMPIRAPKYINNSNSYKVGSGSFKVSQGVFQSTVLDVCDSNLDRNLTNHSTRGDKSHRARGSNMVLKKHMKQHSQLVRGPDFGSYISQVERIREKSLNRRGHDYRSSKSSYRLPSSFTRIKIGKQESQQVRDTMVRSTLLRDSSPTGIKSILLQENKRESTQVEYIQDTLEKIGCSTDEDFSTKNRLNSSELLAKNKPQTTLPNSCKSSTQKIKSIECAEKQIQPTPSKQGKSGFTSLDSNSTPQVIRKSMGIGQDIDARSAPHETSNESIELAGSVETFKAKDVASNEFKEPRQSVLTQNKATAPAASIVSRTKTNSLSSVDLPEVSPTTRPSLMEQKQEGYLQLLSEKIKQLKHTNTGAMRQLVDHEHWLLLQASYTKLNNKGRDAFLTRQLSNKQQLIRALGSKGKKARKKAIAELLDMPQGLKEFRYGQHSRLKGDGLVNDRTEYKMNQIGIAADRANTEIANIGMADNQFTTQTMQYLGSSLAVLEKDYIQPSPCFKNSVSRSVNPGTPTESRDKLESIDQIKRESKYNDHSVRQSQQFMDYKKALLSKERNSIEV